jgi:hypothetical protein
VSTKTVAVPVELHVVKRGRSLDKWFVSVWKTTHDKPEGWTLADFTPLDIVQRTGAVGRKVLSARVSHSPDDYGVVGICGCSRSEYESWEEGLQCLGWQNVWTRKLTRAEAEDYQKKGAAY